MKLITLTATLLVFASPAARASSLGRSGYNKLLKDGFEFTPEPRILLADATKPPQLLTVFQQQSQSVCDGVIQQPVCNGDTLICGAASSLSRGNFTIISTNHPGNYENDEDCKYALTTEYPGDTITLTCQAFDVEAHSSCAWDWLEVDGQKFCGTSGPNGVSTESTMEINWHSDYIVTRPGYNCTVQVGLLNCGASILSRGTFTINSTNHPENYENNEDCDYSLTSKYPGDTITITCQEFDVEAESSCAWDYLEVENQKYCGTNGPIGVSTESTMTINWHSDVIIPRPGYSCTIQVGPLSCGASTLSPGTFTISSTNHPGNYENCQDCDYYLTSKYPGDTITLTCQEFDVEAHSSCAWDYLEVEGQKYCGTNGPSGVSTESTMMISWNTDFSVVRSGYSCTVEVITQTPSACSCGMPNRASRIVGGVETEMNEYPWQVGVYHYVGGGLYFVCGGSVINNRYVLTAAHCTEDVTANDIEIFLRDHNIQTFDGEIPRSVVRIIQHPNYMAPHESGYDFSLLELSEPIVFPSDNKIAPVCLPSDPSVTYTGVDAIVSGWGDTSEGGSGSDVLMEVTVPVISNTECNNQYPGSINPSMICAGDLVEGGIDACQGDSGGPLVTMEDSRYTLIGVVSWGIGCANSEYPGVYGRVTEVLNWILDETADGVYCGTEPIQQ